MRVFLSVFHEQLKDKNTSKNGQVKSQALKVFLPRRFVRFYNLGITCYGLTFHVK